MSEKILKTDIVREKGFIYFCGTSNDGKIVVCKAKAGRSKKN